MNHNLFAVVFSYPYICYEDVYAYHTLGHSTVKDAITGCFQLNLNKAASLQMVPGWTLVKQAHVVHDCLPFHRGVQGDCSRCHFCNGLDDGGNPKIQIKHDSNRQQYLLNRFALQYGSWL